MTDEEFQTLKNKIEKDFLIRCKLAELAGFKANPKNARALMNTEFDLSIRELYLEILFRKPDKAAVALNLIQSYYQKQGE